MKTHSFLLQIGYQEYNVQTPPSFFSLIPVGFWVMLSIATILNLAILFWLIRKASRADAILDELYEVNWNLEKIIDVLPKKDPEETEPKLFGGKTVAELYTESLNKNK